MFQAEKVRYSIFPQTTNAHSAGEEDQPAQYEKALENLEGYIRHLKDPFLFQHITMKLSQIGSEGFSMTLGIAAFFSEEEFPQEMMGIIKI